jgi:hypothetical protein
MVAVVRGRGRGASAGAGGGVNGGEGVHVAVAVNVNDNDSDPGRRSGHVRMVGRVATGTWSEWTRRRLRDLERALKVVESVRNERGMTRASRSRRAFSGSRDDVSTSRRAVTRDRVHVNEAGRCITKAGGFVTKVGCLVTAAGGSVTEGFVRFGFVSHIRRLTRS